MSPRCTLLLGDCLERLRALPDASVDSIVTDPPAGIGFMGKGWDSDKGGRDHWIAWLASIMREALRVLRPGGHALVWALPRTSHWTATAIEDAGFEIRDRHHHIAAGDTRLSEFVATLDARQREQLARILETQESAVLLGCFGSGFPKSLNIAKNGALRWDGHGTALKPAVEHWILARRPLDGTVAANVLAHGTGALAIDACRIGAEERPVMVRTETVVEATAMAGVSTGATPSGETTTLGRWPAHLSLEHAAGCRQVGEVVEDRPLRESDPIPASEGAGHTLRDGFGGSRAAGTSPVTRSVYDCVEGCPVRVLDEQSGERKVGGAGKATPKKNGPTYGEFESRSEVGYGDTGGASRFFLVTDPGFRYVAKPSRREKDAGLESLAPSTGGEATGRKDGSAGTKNPRAGAGRTGGARNTHATVKPVNLMRWLVRLITPPGGLVLDPFAGSGTTGVACADEGMRFLGIEQDEKHHEIARLRLRKAYGAVETELPAQAAMPAVLIAQPRSAS